MGRGGDGEKRRERGYATASYWLSGGGGGLVTKSCPTLVIPWTAAYRASPSMGFSRQEYWSGVPLPSPYDQPRQHIRKQRHYFINKGPSSQGYGFFQ